MLAAVLLFFLLIIPALINQPPPFCVRVCTIFNIVDKTVKI